MAEDTNLIELTIEIVSAFVGQNNMRPDDVPQFIASTHAAILNLKSSNEAPAPEAAEPEHQPAVSVRKSLGSKDHIISMIDGKPYKTLRRHLSTNGLTPDEYRARYNLPASYPMVAENYSAARREMARSIGLGRKPGQRVKSAAPAEGTDTASAPVTKGRGGRKPRAQKDAGSAGE